VIGNRYQVFKSMGISTWPQTQPTRWSMQPIYKLT
jgi:hypothetical protein